MRGLVRERREKPVLLRALTLVTRTVALYWLALFFLQRWILFPAPVGEPRQTRPPDVQSIWLESPAGRTEAWYLPGSEAPRPAPILVFAHGNAERIEDWPSAFEQVREWGIGVLLVEYPGYGRSPGSPSSATIQAACEAAFDWAAGQPFVDRSRIFLYGRSLGGGAMASLSLTRPAAALVLESTFTSTADFAARVLLPPLFLRDRFDTLTAVQAFAGPILIVHGVQDPVIPVAHGERLAAAARVALRALACGHNDCPRPWTLLRLFLEEKGLLPQPARPTIEQERRTVDGLPRRRGRVAMHRGPELPDPRG
jgi:uncharacterized protein